MNDYISKLKKLCEKATPGPWVTKAQDYRRNVRLFGSDAEVCTVWTKTVAHRSDAELIAESRTAIPKLITALERAIRQRDNLCRILEEERGDVFASHEIHICNAELDAILKEGE